MKTLKEEIQHIELKSIVPDENQPRKYFDPVKLKALKSSIERYGIQNPAIVEKIGDKYLLTDGERRFRAATELKLKTIPCIVIEPQSSLDRRIQQFHIQEQHEGWTAAEKAVVVNDIATELRISIQELADMMGIDKDTARKYISFSSLIERKEFVKHEISLTWAPPMMQLSRLAERLYPEALNEPFTHDLKRKLEKAVLAQIRNGELTKPVQITKLKDSFTKSPKDIIKFIEEGVTVSEMFLNTKAQGAYHLRNWVNHVSYASNSLKKYMENPDVKPTEKQISVIRCAKDDMVKFLKTVGE